MKQSDISVGGNYIAKVSGKLTVVRVESIRPTMGFKGRAGVSISLKNLKTGRMTGCASAQRLKRPATADEVARALGKTPSGLTHAGANRTTDHHAIA